MLSTLPKAIYSTTTKLARRVQTYSIHAFSYSYVTLKTPFNDNIRKLFPSSIVSSQRRFRSLAWNESQAKAARKRTGANQFSVSSSSIQVSQICLKQLQVRTLLLTMTLLVPQSLPRFAMERLWMTSKALFQISTSRQHRPNKLMCSCRRECTKIQLEKGRTLWFGSIN